jgi:transcriptional regulator GlxA family with amidase domain
LSFLPLAPGAGEEDDRRMDISILLFPGIAPLDAVGPFEVLRNVPGWEVRTVAAERGEARSEGGSLALVADRALEEVEATDILLVPGGFGTRALVRDEGLLDWIRRIDATTKWTTSVCTGALLLAAAGLLEGRRATSNWLLLDALREFGADPVGGRWVQDGKVITAAGVTAGIDMALHLVAEEVGPEMAQAVQLGIEYDPDPPFDSGSPEKAPPEIVELVRAARGGEAALGAERG